MKDRFVTFLLSFVLYVYITHVKFDWEEVTPTAKVFLYVPWFIQATLTWIVSPIFLPEYFIKKTDVYKETIKLFNDAINQ